MKIQLLTLSSKRHKKGEAMGMTTKMLKIYIKYEFSIVAILKKKEKKKRKSLTLELFY